MQQLKTKPWFLPLLVLFFVVHGTAENFGFIFFTEVLKIGLVIFGFVALFFLLIKVMVKNNLYAALICFFISAWLLFFGAILNFVQGFNFLGWLHSYKVFVPFMGCTFIAFIFFIRKKNSVTK